MSEQVKGIPERAPEPPYMDFPEAWAFVRTTKLEDHHMRCSWRSGVLCDCNVLWAEYYKRKAARSEQALAAQEARNKELESALQSEKDKPAKTLPRLVVCALIMRGGKVLLERRAPSGVAGLDNKWDLPGGKVEPGERPDEAIIREIVEELSIGVRPIQLLPYLPTSTWTYADGETRHWILAAYICDIISGEPQTTETLQWFDVSVLGEVDIMEADLQLEIDWARGRRLESRSRAHQGT